VDGLTTVLLVHETRQPSVYVFVALCSEHASVLKRATWVAVDELVGFSSVASCEACALPTNELVVPTTDGGQTGSRHLRTVPSV
jgi:hypothetical protein